MTSAHLDRITGQVICASEEALSDMFWVCHFFIHTVNEKGIYVLTPFIQRENLHDYMQFLGFKLDINDNNKQQMIVFCEKTYITF